jgi:hypothetical protein
MKSCEMRVIVLFAFGAGCSATATTIAHGRTLAGDASQSFANAGSALRSARSCALLIGAVMAGEIQNKVNRTAGVRDCPQAAWSQLDVSAVETSGRT